MATDENSNLKRKETIASSLCKHFSLDPEAFSSKVPGNDIKTLYSNILKSSGKESLKNNDEIGLSNSEKEKLPNVMQWMDYIQIKSKGDKEAVKEKKKAPEAEATDKDKELSVSLLNIQVGLIRKAWKHPSADGLLVEEIDVGEAKLRQVVSGLAKYCSPEELTNRRVVLITNVKPGKLRDVMSGGLVPCASNEDHTIVEPLMPPEGAKTGERVSFLG